MRLRTVIAFCAMLAGGVAPATAEVVPAGSGKVMAGPASSFTGKVAVRLLTSPTSPGQAGTAMVTFAPGARSNWHTHPAGQALYVTDGCGWTREAGGPITRICKGDMVYVRPGIRHWHGATSTTSMTHLAITETLEGKNVSWQEPVRGTDYHGPER